jgi:diguanylate cyclase (GGDEF)-like protein
VLQVDVLSAFVICSAAAWVGAAMLRLADPRDPALRRAMDDLALGLAVLGVALGSVLFAGPAPGPWVHALMTGGTIAATVCFHQGLARLAGDKPLTRPWALAALLGGGVLGLVGPLAGTRALVDALAIGLAVTTSGMAWAIRRFTLRPRDGIERAIGWSFLVLATSGWVRVAVTLQMPGEPPPHLVHVPAWMATPLAIFYGVMPIILATLILSLVNTRLQRQLNLKASTDELTGAMTRRALRELAPALLQRQREQDQAIALLLLDLDHFKAINDEHGHASGDLVLQNAARTVRAQLRADALLARYGGEEFVALVPVADMAAARRAAERVREAVAGATWQGIDGRTLAVTTSVGVTLVGPIESIDDALRRADDALYRAKRDGRNRVQVGLVAA